MRFPSQQRELTIGRRGSTFFPNLLVLHFGVSKGMCGERLPPDLLDLFHRKFIVDQTLGTLAPSPQFIHDSNGPVFDRGSLLSCLNDTAEFALG